MLLKTTELFACASANTVRIWDLNAKNCVATLEGHLEYIVFLEKIDEHRYAEK